MNTLDIIWGLACEEAAKTDNLAEAAAQLLANMEKHGIKPRAGVTEAELIDWAEETIQEAWS